MTQDDFLWLEKATPAVSDWVRAQNEYTQQQLDLDPRFAPLHDAILANMQDTRQIPLFSVHDDVLYNFHQDAAQPRGVYRATTLDEYTRAGTHWQTQWKTVLDIDALAASEGYDWYLSGVDHCTLQPTRCLVNLNIGGSDACVIREYDLATQSFVAGGFEFPFGKSQVSWRDANSVFVCPAWDEDQITSAGYSREVVLLERGQAWEDAASMIVLPEQILKVAAWRFLDVGLDAAGGDGVVPFDLIEVAQDFYRRSYFYLNSQHGGDAEPLHLPLPVRCVIEAYSHGDLIIRLDADWRYGEQDFAAGSLIALACDAASGELGRAQLLFAPDVSQTGFATQSVQMLEATLNGLLIVILDNVTSRVISMQWCDDGQGDGQSGHWQEIANPIRTGGVIEIVAQPWRSDTLYYLYSDFLTPASLYRHELGSINPPQLLRAQPAAFDSTDLQVQQYHARSKDGTAVPYFIVCDAGIDLDGNTPVLMYGYGGFAVPLLPYYLDNLGEHWLRQGGAYVVANIRGGGEFGPAWHEAGRGKNRQNSFVDFIAIAENLIARGITRPAKLAIQGGSNGGLLVATCMVQRPELFGAVVCEVPILDMLRFDQLGAGASWIAEYGNPKKDAEILGVYSPYQNLKCATEQHYPRVLLTTSAEDDRVHPAHARKMAARLQELGHDALFFESQSGGHAGQTRQQHTAEELARVLVFLRQCLVMDSKI
ncbi:prolyl oligopeptidase family serine peptidase [Chitinibacter sp. S2-10]|uniref:prolyl oligopeptidase family serine peptidase n=1 Tax=Chitinibacter sp. S2-10 TaxID=3373597 RepID=UPI003977C591